MKQRRVTSHTREHEEEEEAGGEDMREWNTQRRQRESIAKKDRETREEATQEEEEETEGDTYRLFLYFVLIVVLTKSSKKDKVSSLGDSLFLHPALASSCLASPSCSFHSKRQNQKHQVLEQTQDKSCFKTCVLPKFLFFIEFFLILLRLLPLTLPCDKQTFETFSLSCWRLLPKTTKWIKVQRTTRSRVTKSWMNFIHSSKPFFLMSSLSLTLGLTYKQPKGSTSRSMKSVCLTKKKSCAK